MQKRILQNSSQSLEDARIHAMLTYRTPQSFDFRFEGQKMKKKVFIILKAGLFITEKNLKRFNLDAYIMMNHLLSSINIERDGNLAKEIIRNIDAEIHLIAGTVIYFSLLEDKNIRSDKKLKKIFFIMN